MEKGVIHTRPIYPPIEGAEEYNWTAVRDTHPAGEPIGYGVTQQDAINDLLNLEDSYVTGSIKDWYCATYPTDDMGPSMDPDATFHKVFEENGDIVEDIYFYIGAFDSIVRERVFEELAKRSGVSYDIIYDEWIDSVNQTFSN